MGTEIQKKSLVTFYNNRNRKSPVSRKKIEISKKSAQFKPRKDTDRNTEMYGQANDDITTENFASWAGQVLDSVFGSEKIIISMPRSIFEAQVVRIYLTTIKTYQPIYHFCSSSVPWVIRFITQ